MRSTDYLSAKTDACPDLIGPDHLRKPDRNFERPIDVLADRERYTDELAKQFAYHSGEGDD
jgi:hypothetical protein